MSVGANGTARIRRCMAVGFERNESSRRAAEWAALELLPDGELVLVHACRSLHAPPSPITSPEDREQLGRAIVEEFLLEANSSVHDLDLAVEILDADRDRRSHT